MAKFWMWNNGREIINIEAITYIEVLNTDETGEENDDPIFAEVSLIDRKDVVELTREQYNSLIGFIKAATEHITIVR